MRILYKTAKGNIQITQSLKIFLQAILAGNPATNASLAQLVRASVL